jgi:hypothetical protein
MANVTPTPAISLVPPVSTHDTFDAPVPPSPLEETKKVPVMSVNVDRFSALDDLVSNSTGNHSRTSSLSHASGPTSLDSLTTRSLSTLALQTPTSATQAPIVNPATSLKISEYLGGFPSADINDDADNGFIMGGAVGTGVLEPMAPAPAVPPPPPPFGSLF